MPVNYPTSLDDFTDPLASDPTTSPTVPHATQHANVNTAVEQLEQKVGVDASLPSGPSGVLGANGVGKSIWRAIANADVAAAAGIAKSKLAALGIVDADVATAAAILVSKLSAGGTGNRLLRTSDGVTPTWGQAQGADIANATMLDANFANGTINGSRLITGSVTTTQILDGTIQTADIAGRNVSNGLSIAGAAGATVATTAGVWFTVNGMVTPAMTLDAASFLVFAIQLQAAHNVAGGVAQFRVVRNDTGAQIGYGTPYVGNPTANADFPHVGAFVAGSPGAGNFQFRLEGNMITSGQLTVVSAGAILTVIELKR